MSVPNTNNFSLQDVIDEINPSSNDLATCFAEAIDSGFDSAYEGSKNSLLNFRNYSHQVEPLQTSSNQLTLSAETNSPDKFAAAALDEEFFVGFWNDLTDNKGRLQLFKRNITTNLLSQESQSQSFSYGFTDGTAIAVDTNHAVLFRGENNQGICQMFRFNKTNGTISNSGNRITFDSSSASHNSLVHLSSGRLVNFWNGANQYCGQVYSYDTTNLTITQLGAKYEATAHAADGYYSAIKIDNNHVMNFWGSVQDGFCQLYHINSTNGAITPLGNFFQFEYELGTYNSSVLIDDEHVMNFWSGYRDDGYCQIFHINKTTGQITPRGSAYEFDWLHGRYNSATLINSSHVLNFWAGGNSSLGYGYCQVFEFDQLTGNISPIDSKLKFSDYGRHNESIKIDDEHIINFWSGVNQVGGFIQAFKVTPPIT